MAAVEYTMSRKSLGKRLPPMAIPVCLAGANVQGRPNFCAIAWFTIMDDEPPTIGLVMAKKRCTKDGMLENGTFSVNIPSRDMAMETDHCGLRSGYAYDKSEVFQVSYGILGTAPLIDRCPVSMECRLRQVVELEGTDLVIGEIENVLVDEEAIDGQGFDAAVAAPLLLWMPHGPYHSLGDKVADAYKVGKGIRGKRIR